MNAEEKMEWITRSTAKSPAPRTRTQMFESTINTHSWSFCYTEEEHDTNREENYGREEPKFEGSLLLLIYPSEM